MAILLNMYCSLAIVGYWFGLHDRALWPWSYGYITIFNKKYPIIYVTSIFPKATLCLPQFFRVLFQLCSPLVALLSVPCSHCRHPSVLQCPISLFSHAVPCLVTLSTNRKVLKWTVETEDQLKVWGGAKSFKEEITDPRQHCLWIYFRLDFVQPIAKCNFEPIIRGGFVLRVQSSPYRFCGASYISYLWAILLLAI